MAYSPNNEIERALGGFRHKETKAQFEYRDNDTGMFPEFPHQVYLTNGEMRFARIMKTVAVVVVDEEEYGLIIEKWPIKTLWARENLS